MSAPPLAPPVPPPEPVYVPTPAPLAWQPVDEPPPERQSVRRLAAALGLLAFLTAVHVAVSVFAGEVWYARLYITATYAVPCALAMALLGLVRWKTPAWLRIGFALVTALAVFLGLRLEGVARLLILDLFLLFLPAWAVLGVTGTGRFRWSPLQFLGATLVLEAVWIPLYGSFPALTQLATASGTLQPYSVPEMYTIVTQKLLHETFLIVAGILLLTRRFPVVQKRPETRDWHSALAAVGTTSRYNAWITLGLGATTFLLAFFGSLLLQDLLLRTPVGQSGADDTRVFERITPELVILLSFAAGAGEELIFRGVLQPAFERVFRRMAPPSLAAVAAIVAQAVLFGVVHAGYGNLLHVLLPFAFGLLTGTIYRLWGLGPAVYAHFMIDVFAFGYDAAQSQEWVGIALVVLLFLNILAGLAAPLWVLLAWVDRRFGGLGGLGRAFTRRGRTEDPYAPWPPPKP